jgi:hypothetical protein
MKRYLLFILILIGCSSDEMPLPSGNKDAAIKTCSENYKISIFRSESISECSFVGGSYIYTWTDVNNNGWAEDSEICERSYLCDGSSGPEGASGTNTLVYLERQEYISACGVGGVIFVSGLDVSKDSILQAEEVVHSTFVCDGAAAGSAKPVVDFKYPCGKFPGAEVVLQFEAGYVAYLQDGVARRLSVLEENILYQTTDTKKCLFKIIDGQLVGF